MIRCELFKKKKFQHVVKIFIQVLFLVVFFCLLLLQRSELFQILSHRGINFVPPSTPSLDPTPKIKPRRKSRATSVTLQPGSQADSGPSDGRMHTDQLSMIDEYVPGKQSEETVEKHAMLSKERIASLEFRTEIVDRTRAAEFVGFVELENQHLMALFWLKSLASCFFACSAELVSLRWTTRIPNSAHQLLIYQIIQYFPMIS
jgi:hypothetical protein